MNQNQKKWLYISVTLSLIALIIMMALTFNAGTMNALKSCNIWYILLALVLHIFSILIWALRIMFMCGSLNYRIPFFHTVNLVCANLLIAAITPSQIGGEAVRIYELHKVNVPVVEASAIVLMERVFDGIVLSIGTVIGVFFLAQFFNDFQFPSIYMETAYMATAVFTLLLFAFFVLVKRPMWTKTIIKKIYNILSRKISAETLNEKFQLIDNTVDQFYKTVGLFGKHAKLGAILGIIMTVLFWASEFLIASVLMIGLGLPPSYIISFIFQLIIAMIMMIPLTPGGVGVAEASIAGFYSHIIPMPLVGIFVLLWRLILYYFNVIVGVISTLYIVRRDAKKGLSQDTEFQDTE